MKRTKEKQVKSKKFLKLPSYPGGNKEFIRFIEENLKYPDEALKNLIEGTVYLEYTVDNMGNVSDETIIHGLGYGCDEEALRLVRQLKYEPVKNRGVRLKSKMKTRIRFELPAHLKQGPTLQVSYTSAPARKTEKPENPSRPSLGYTITINP